MKNDPIATRPIGVFDSGLGGLTVVREIRRQLPDETIIYLGDNARVPYGTRSNATIERYARNCAEFILRQEPKMLVVACNTVSAVALPALRQLTDIPVLGVIEAGARTVATENVRRVGVIGTAGTIRSNAYIEKIQALVPDCAVFQKPTPLFVPLAEEGWTEGDVPESAARHYLSSLVCERIELLLLGCTHYPILKSTIQRTLSALSSGALVVDSAAAMAREVSNVLKTKDIFAPAPREAQARVESTLACFVTDLPESFEAVSARFLGVIPDTTRQIDIS
jgi:glutamate racemase